MLLIFGIRSTALEIAELASWAEPEWRIVHVMGDQEEDFGQGAVRIGELDSFLKSQVEPVSGIISMADMSLRADCVGVMEAFGIPSASLIHPSATVSPAAQIGAGCYIGAGARVSVNAQVGAHSMLNLNVTYGHDSICGSHTVVNPGAAISGNVTIGNRVLVGANSFIHQGKAIGDDCQIDALTHVWRDMPNGHVATSRSLRVDRRINLPR